MNPSPLGAAPLYQTADLRRIEAAASDQPLMQRAGAAAAELSARLSKNNGLPVLVLAGPGNNGGDAFEAARLLRAHFFKVVTIFLGDPEQLPKDAAQAFARFTASGGQFLRAIPEGVRWGLIIDGLFGIGLTREIAAPYSALIRQANVLAERDHCPLLALDCPSGLDADNGSCHGETIRATQTITFIAGKPGLFTADGPDFCGEVSVAALALDAEAMQAPSGRLLDRTIFSGHLQPRRRNSHKGSFGNTGILGGAPGMTGAALLAARAALRLGSGRVYVGLLDPHAPALDPQQPELMLRYPDSLANLELSALACGPGLGQSADARSLLHAAIGRDIPLILDADALNLIASEGELSMALATRSADTVLTPHPAEAARLLDCSVVTIQADRVAAAQELASHFNAIVALKGCGTIIASPDGNWLLNTSGNPGLASAGTGDVLTGMIAALSAQGWPASMATAAAVNLHGAAADQQVAQGTGPIGLTAGELIDGARRCLNAWCAGT